MSKKVYFETPQGVKLQFETASIVSRIVAFFIDIVCYYLFILLFVSIFKDIIDSVEWLALLLGVLFFFLPLIVEILTKGQSIGKILLRIQVVPNSSLQADNTMYFSRYVIKILEITLTFGLLPVVAIGFSKRGQSFADYFAGAILIVKEKNGRFNLKELTEIATKDNYEITFPQVTKLKEEDIIMLKSLLTETKGKRGSARNRELINEAGKKLEHVLSVHKGKQSNTQFISKVISDFIVSTR
jgi:uncharacterized RDD family membrane protein YckC